MVLFSEEGCAEAALQAAASAQVVDMSGYEAAEEAEKATGLRAWVLQHKAQWPGNEELQQQVWVKGCI